MPPRLRRGHSVETGPTPRLRRGYSVEMGRGDAAAATWGSRQRGGGDVGYSVETNRGDAATASWTVRGDGLRRRRGRSVETPVEVRSRPARASGTFDEFLRVDGGAFRAETRLVSWGLYADQLAAIRRVGFRDPDLLVIFSEPALRDAARLLDFVVAWLGLARFDFARLRTYRDARPPRGFFFIATPALSFARAPRRRRGAAVLRPSCGSSELGTDGRPR